jgi:hypothetical protein
MRVVPLGGPGDRLVIRGHIFDGHGPYPSSAASVRYLQHESRPRG